MTRPMTRSWGDALLRWASAHFAASAVVLRFRLFQLGFLLSRQNGKHLLMKLRTLAHQLRLEARHFRQFLSRQCFVERTAFVRLTQLLSLGMKLFAQGLVCLGKVFADLFDLRFLVLS